MGWNWWRYRGGDGSLLVLAAVDCLCCLRIDVKVGRDWTGGGGCDGMAVLR